MAARLVTTKTLGAPTRARGATSSHCLGRGALLCVRMGSSNGVAKSLTFRSYKSQRSPRSSTFVCAENRGRCHPVDPRSSRRTSSLTAASRPSRFASVARTPHSLAAGG